MQDDVVITAEGVYKDFVLPHERAGTVKGVFTSMFRHATSKKEKQHALKNISFEVKQGEFFGIVGRNGSGKSTLLKILASIYQPTKGKVTTRGRLVPFIELGVGFNPELTGRDNIYLNGAMLGFSSKEVGAMYDEIVAFAELERFMDQKLKNYSSGMQVRLAFSMAIRANADILLIDEVLAVGDADFQRKCFNYFKKLKRNNKTVVFVSHDMEAVREYCDRAMFIEKNEIVSIGDPDTIAQAYTRLFTPQAATAEPDKTTDRWGDERAKIESVKVQVSEELITIKETVKVNEALNGCVFGIRICNAEGEHITGTNTKLEKLKIGELNKGESVNVTWVMPNVFSSGDYTLDTTVQHLDAITVHDWWDNAASFSTQKDRRLAYVVDPGFQVKIEKLN